MSTRVLLRVSLPDRPGALGAIASRIGAVQGNVIGVEILEQEGNVAVDEIVVALPDESLVGLLVNEILEVDGVAIDEVVLLLPDSPLRSRKNAYERAQRIVAEASIHGLLSRFVEEARDVAHADWTALVSSASGDGGAGGPLILTHGEAPPEPWQDKSRQAIFTGMTKSADGIYEHDGTTWLPAVTDVLALGVHRPGHALTISELDELRAIAKLFRARWAELEPKS